MSTRPSLRRGLPYGWWRSPGFWVTSITLILVVIMMVVLGGAWFLGWQ